MESGLTRRAVLQGGGAAALAVFAGGATGAIAVEPGAATFLSEAELETLRAAVDRFVPGKPETLDDGAVAAGCAEGIDALLAAFATDPPRIYAGAPFSDRGGSPVNHFERFTALDAYERKAWRLRIEGSKGRRKLEFNGPVKGYQATYREGLAALGAGFAAAPGPARDIILRTSDDPAIAAFVDVAFPHTLQLIYGAPEYGGNRDLIGWKYTNYAGDVQPRGWTRAEIEQPGPVRRQAAVPAELLALAPLASAEVAHGIVARSGETLSGLEAEMKVIRRGA